MKGAEQSKRIVNTIYQQIGGGKFMCITGSKKPIAINNGLRLSLGKNKTIANRLDITLDLGADLYDMRFYKESASKTSLAITQKTVASQKGVFFDQLTDIFERVTGLVTAMPTIRIASAGGNQND